MTPVPAAVPLAAVAPDSAADNQNGLLADVSRPARGLPACPIALAATGSAALAVLLRRLHAHLLKPIAQLHDWAAHMHSGRYTTRIPTDMQGGFAPLARDLNHLCDELRSLNLDMAARVRRQTLHLARKTRSLEILYDIASSLSKSRSLDELLESFLDTFVQLFDARAAMVRLVTENGQLRLVASRGLDPQTVEREKLMPMDRCLCGQTASDGKVQIQKGARPAPPFWAHRC
jgi:two-component system nitrate/nitrite sensor histidine kinase NarX